MDKPVFIAQLPAEEGEPTPYYGSIYPLKSIPPLRPKNSYEFRCNITLQDIEEESIMSTNASVTDFAQEQREEDVKMDDLCCRVHTMFFWHNVSLISRKLRRLKERVRKSTQAPKNIASTSQT